MAMQFEIKREYKRIRRKEICRTEVSTFDESEAESFFDSLREICTEAESEIECVRVYEISDVLLDSHLMKRNPDFKVCGLAWVRLSGFKCINGLHYRIETIVSMSDIPE